LPSTVLPRRRTSRQGGREAPLHFCALYQVGHPGKGAAAKRGNRGPVLPACAAACAVEWGRGSGRGWRQAP